MIRRNHLPFLLAAFLFFLLPCAAQTLNDPEAWQRDLAAWRSAHEKAISSPDGWLALADLHWLKPGFQSFGSAPDCKIHLPAPAPAHLGLLTVSGKTVQLLSPAGGFPAGLQLDGQPARETALDTSDQKPSTLAIGSLSIVVTERAGRYVLRVKDSASPARAAFHGLHWFPPDPRQVVLASWTPYPSSHIAELPTALGNSLHLSAPGLVTFELGKDRIELEPVVEDPQAHSLLFILRDASSASSTYPGGRLLRTQIPDHGLGQPGTVVLDLNRLENPPCAYTNFATCPLPTEKNRIAVAIEAGEKRYLPE